MAKCKICGENLLDGTCVRCELSHIDAEPQIVPSEIISTCRLCGNAVLERGQADKSICRSCEDKQRQTTALQRKSNAGWLERAREDGIPLWERQAEETTEEWEAWQHFRDLWPDQRPTVSRVAAALGVSVQSINQMSVRWSWPARLQAWVREVDAERVAQRRAQARAMSEQHVSMAEQLRNKMEVAISCLDPEDVTPGELTQLLKEMQRLEQTGRDSLAALEAQQAGDLGADTAVGDAATYVTPHGDLDQVVAILSQAGALRDDQGRRVAVRQVTMTEAVTDDFS